MGSGSGKISDEAKQEKVEAISDIGFFALLPEVSPSEAVAASVSAREAARGRGGSEGGNYHSDKRGDYQERRGGWTITN